MVAVRTTSLVGRSNELQDIDGAIAEDRGLFFSGPAGVGKTRLLNETKLILENHGFDVIEIIGAQATADIPLAPLLGLVDLEQQGDLARLVLSALTRRARDNRVAMLVDDIQRLDEASASLIHRIATSGIALVFATHRSTDALTSAAESLWKDGHLDRIAVPPMTRPEQRALTSLLVGGVDDDTESWLWNTAAGHPLFLRELLVDAALSGRVTDTPNHSSIASIAPPVGVPPRLAELVGQNVRALDPDSRRALEIVAVGGSAPVALIGQLAGDAAVQRLLDDAVCSVKDGILFPAHPLFGETATATLTNSALRELQITLADALEGIQANPVQSTLLKIAAGTQVDESRLRQAFAIAMRSRQPKPMQEIGSALLDASGDPMVGAQLGLAYAMTRDWDRADKHFEQAIASANDDIVEEFYLIWLQASFEYRGNPADAVALAEYVVANTAGPANQVARALQFRVRMFFEPLAPILEERAKMFDEDLDPRAEALVRLDQTTVAWSMLRIPLALSTPNAHDIDGVDLITEARSYQITCAARSWRMGITPARSEAAERRAVYASLGDADAENSAAIAVALFSMTGINCGEVLAGFDTMRDLEARLSDRRSQQMLSGVHAWAVTRLRTFSQPASHFLKLLEDADLSTYALSGTLFYVAASRAARRDGQDPEPLRQKALDLARWRYDRTNELVALRDEYCFGDSATKPTIARLAELAELAGPGLAQLYADEGAAHLARDGQLLAELSVAAEEFGAVGLAWDMAAGAQRFLHESGDGVAALRAERRSQRLATLDPLARSPLHELMEPVLTNRELEVGELVAQGRSNSETADELYLSPRTVGRHLERIYRKLDISRRQELTDVLASCESLT